MKTRRIGETGGEKRGEAIPRGQSKAATRRQKVVVKAIAVDLGGSLLIGWMVSGV